MSSVQSNIRETISSSPDISSIIDDLPKELLEAMKNEHIILVGVNDVKKPLSRAIYDAKKQEIIKPLKTQINFKVPDSLKNSKEERDNITKKDLLFFKKSYEEEAVNVNKIINSVNLLNNQLLNPLKSIKETLKEYQENFINNINNIKCPYKNKKDGLDSISFINEDKKKIENEIEEVNKDMNSFEENSLILIKEYNNMNKEIIDDILSFIDSFKKLTDSVENLKREITRGFEIFENCSPDFEDLDNLQKIKETFDSIIDQLSKITKLISENQEMLEENQKKKDEKNKNLSFAEKMMEICQELNNKAKEIIEKTNMARVKVNLNEIKVEPLDLKGPNIEEIKQSINEIKKEIETTNEKNNKIKEEIKIKTEDMINRTRFDILFIVDITNSINTYLDDIKNNFRDMINKINNNCPTATIYIGFIGYTDFSELYLGDEYINIDFKIKSEAKEIDEKIKNLESHGGGDEAEDLAGAFKLALDKNWKGFSRFAILATDAPCHGKEFHSEDVGDNYLQGDPEKRNIKEFVKSFAENNISLFCAKFNDATEQMYKIFEEEYKKGKSNNSQCEFTVQKCEDICETIVEKACLIYKNRKDEEKEIKAQ